MNKVLKIKKYHLLLVLVSFALTVSGCDNIRKKQPKMHPEAVHQARIANFSIDDDEQVNEIERIVEMHGAKLQSLAYDSDDSELSLSISYYPKKLTKSDFENLEAELKQLTGVNVAVFRKSVSIKAI